MQTQFALVINTLGIMQMMTIKEVHCAPPVTLLEVAKVKSLAFLLSTPTYSMADVEQVPRAVVDKLSSRCGSSASGESSTGCTGE